jgi:hypothetical protein
MADKRIGYLVDQSLPPLAFVAIQGRGDVLEHGLRKLESGGRDLSPIVVESRQRVVAINLYEPDPISVQIVQHAGRLERMTEILGVGIGLGVLREVKAAAGAFDVELSPLSERFRNRIEKEKAAYAKAFSRLRGDAIARRAGFARVLGRLQDKLRREAGLLDRKERREKDLAPSPQFRARLPRAVAELERAVEDLFPGPLRRAGLEHVAEVASALSCACRVEGLRDASALARSIAALVDVSPDVLQGVERETRRKLAQTLVALKSRTRDFLSDTAS